MRKFLGAMRAGIAQVRGLSREGAGLIGCALVSFGAWMVYAPAGFIVAGLLLVAGAVLTPKADD